MFRQAWLLLLIAASLLEAGEAKGSFSLTLKRLKHGKGSHGKYGKVPVAKIGQRLMNGNFSGMLSKVLHGAANVYSEDDESFMVDLNFGPNIHQLTTIRVLIDTGTSATWVPHANCRSTAENRNNCRDQNGHGPPSRPQTYTARSEEPAFDHFRVDYGFYYPEGGTVKAHAEGKFAIDKLWLGTPGNEGATQIDDFKFGVADFIQMHDDYGCLGLGAREDEYEEDDSKTSHFLDVISKKLEDKSFTLYFHHNTPDDINAGRITFGEYDRVNCAPVLNTVPVIKRKDSLGWDFRVNKVMVGNRAVLTESFVAMADSGSTYMYLPRKDFVDLMTAIGGQHINTEDGVKFDFNDERAKPIIECNRFNENVKIKLEIGDRFYSIPINALKYDLQDGWCQIHIVPHDEKVWLLGAPWTLSYCVYHTFNEGPVSDSESESDVSMGSPSSRNSRVSRIINRSSRSHSDGEPEMEIKPRIGFGRVIHQMDHYFD